MPDAPVPEQSTASPAPAAVPLELEYHAFISKIDQCPAAATMRCSEPAFRAVHADLNHTDNFLPQAITQPERLAKASKRKQCGLWSLSLYSDPDQLRSLILKVEETSPEFRKVVGDWYAKMDVQAHHGRRTQEDGFGHYNFYQYTNFDPHASVIEHAPLFP